MLRAGLFEGRETLALAIGAGLVIGKPLGFLLAAVLVIRTGLADQPKSFNLQQVAGAGALAGIGFTMSLFIAGRAFPDPGDFVAAKASIFLASAFSAAFGCLLLTRAAKIAAH